MYGCFNKDPSFSRDWQILVCSAISKIIRKSPKNPMVRRKMGVDAAVFEKKGAPFSNSISFKLRLYIHLTIYMHIYDNLLTFYTLSFVFFNHLAFLFHLLFSSHKSNPFVSFSYSVLPSKAFTSFKVLIRFPAA